MSTIWEGDVTGLPSQTRFFILGDAYMGGISSKSHALANMEPSLGLEALRKAKRKGKFCPLTQVVDRVTPEKTEKTN